MARDFDGSTQHGTATAPVTATPITIVFWAHLDAIDGVAVALLRNTVGQFWGWYVDFTGTSVRAVVADNNSFAVASQTTVSTGTWHHCGGVFASTTSRTAYLDGSAGTEETTSKTPSDVTGLALSTAARVLDSGVGNWVNGRLAEIALYDVALTAGEMSSLSKGVSPLKIRPASLVFYAPFMGRYSPEIEVITNKVVTLTNAPTQSNHPRIIYPRSRWMRRFTTASAAANAMLLLAPPNLRGNVNRLHGGFI